MSVVGAGLRIPAGEDLPSPGVEHGEHVLRKRERRGGEGVQGGVLRQGDAGT